MQDLSHLADNSITATSQSAGNMTSSNATAMTAPGSQPVTPLPPAKDQDTPNLTMTAEIAPGTSGKPQASGQAHKPPPPAWGKTGTPDVTRIPAPAPPEVTGAGTEVKSGGTGSGGNSAAIGNALSARGSLSGRGANPAGSIPAGG